MVEFVLYVRVWWVIGMCVHRVGAWVAGEWDHCPVDCEPGGTRGRGEGTAGEGCGRDCSACESLAGRGLWAVGMGCVMREGTAHGSQRKGEEQYVGRAWVFVTCM